MATTTPSMAPGPKRAAIAALASAFVPGWGQVYAGRPNRGKRLIVIDGTVLVTVIVLVAWLRFDVLKLWVSSTALTLMMVANLVLLGYRWLAATDAYQLVRDISTPRWQANLLISVATIVLVIPHLVFGYVAMTQYSLISTVFAGGRQPGAIDTTEGSTTPTEAGVVPSSQGTEVLGATITSASGESAMWSGLDRINILLLGADAGAGRGSLRTDTTIVVSLDPETGDAAMFSVPRDMSGAPLPEGMGMWECQCWDDLIANLYRTAEANPDAFPGPDTPGINAIKGAVSEIFGIPIHNYALVTLDGFVDIVDALGGVTIEVPYTIVDETYPHENGSVESITIREGTRHLNGHEALAYARIRRHSDDFARMNRQRCVIEAVVEQSTPTEILFRFGAIAGAVKRSLVTDIPQERLSDFIDLLPRVSTDRIASLRITRADYQIGESPGRVYYDIDRIREDAKALMDDPAAARAELGLDTLDGTCGTETESGA